MPKCSNHDLTQISRAFGEFGSEFRVQFELIFGTLLGRFLSTVNAPIVVFSARSIQARLTQAIFFLFFSHIM
jgi:hypothetical protein